LTIARLKTPASLIPQANTINPWQGQIQRAAYLESRNRLIIATKQGLFSGPIDGSRDFIKLPDTLPIHGMGALVFESLNASKLVIGSFSGLYLWDTKNKIVMELLIENNKPLLAIDYESGLKLLQQRPETIPAMPNALREKSRISLWHALFELHNGRIFEEYIGPFYWLITPAGGISFLLILLSGCLIWFTRKITKAK